VLASSVSDQPADDDIAADAETLASQSFAEYRPPRRRSSVLPPIKPLSPFPHHLEQSWIEDDDGAAAVDDDSNNEVFTTM